MDQSLLMQMKYYIIHIIDQIIQNYLYDFYLFCFLLNVCQTNKRHHEKWIFLKELQKSLMNFSQTTFFLHVHLVLI